MTFIDANRGEFGVEPICTTLQVALSTYYAAKTRPPSARQVRDAALTPPLRSLWKAARRDGLDVGRDQVARLMRQSGIEGVRRGRRGRTTRPDTTAARHHGA